MEDDRLATRTIRELEERLLTPDVRRDREQLDWLLADGFVEFGSSGRIWTRAAVLDELPGQAPFSSSISDFRARELGPALVLATYRVVIETQGSSRSSLRSSIWVQRSGRWQLLFHQGTASEAGDA